MIKKRSTKNKKMSTREERDFAEKTNEGKSFEILNVFTKLLLIH